MENSLERIIPEKARAGDMTGGETLRLHLERYRFAAEKVPAGRILDIACGVGYGTREILSRRGDEITEIVAVDNDAGAIGYARETYGHPRVRFVQHDAYTFSDPAQFDAIVSLETIEHLPDPARFVASVLKSLKPGGKWVCSAPVTPTMDAVPFHLNDFTEASYRELFTKSGLREIDHLLQVQSYSPIRVLQKKEERLEGLRKNLIGYYLSHPRGFVDRIMAILRYGFNNHYLTVVWQKPG